MEIKPPSNELYTAISRIVSTTSQANLTSAPPTDWKVSQLIQAIITQVTDKQLFLDIQGVKANTPKPSTLELHVGDTLKLQIEQLKPMPQFRIVSMQPKPNVDLASNLVKNIISRDNSITPLLKNISFVANRPALQPSPLSADTNAAVRDLFKKIPSVFNLKTAPQVKNHMENSGLFIESKIKNQIVSAIQQIPVNKISSGKVAVNIKPLLQLDLGAQLHRIAVLIRTHLTETKNPPTQMAQTTRTILPSTTNKDILQQQNPAQVNRVQANHVRVPTEQISLQNITHREEAMQTFLRQIESSLTHLQQTQLQNLNESQTGRPLWLMELPIKNGQDIDLFELRISQDESSQAENEGDKIWNITLKFDLNGLGKVKAHITMQNELVSAQFYSEKPEVLNLFQKNFDFLRNRLSYNGLNVGKIECARADLSNTIQHSTETPLDEKS